MASVFKRGMIDQLRGYACRDGVSSFNLDGNLIPTLGYAVGAGVAGFFIGKNVKKSSPANSRLRRFPSLSGVNKQ